MSRQTSIPLPSGRRASSRATCGRAAGIRRSASPAFAACSDDLHIVRRIEQVGEAPSDELMIVEDEDPDDALVVHYVDSGIDHRSRRPPCSWFSRVNVPPRLCSTVPEVGQPTAPGVVAEPDPIIADIDGQPVRVGPDRHAQCRCLSVTSHVSHGFPNDSLDVGDNARVHECVERSRPRELKLNPKNRFELFDDRLDAAAQPVVGNRVLEVEDRGADLADGLVQLLDGLRQSGADRGFVCLCSHTLQTEADRKESLDDVIMQVAGDPVAVFERRQLLLCGPGIGQLECDRGLTGKGLCHVQVGRSEGGVAADPSGDEGAHGRRSLP